MFNVLKLQFFGSEVISVRFAFRYFFNPFTAKCGQGQNSTKIEKCSFIKF